MTYKADVPEVKRGARNSAGDASRLQAIHDLAVENGATCPEMEKEAEAMGEDMPMVTDPKSIDPDEIGNDALIAYGGEAKAWRGDDGKVHIKCALVVFSDPNDPDLTGDYFDAKTDYGIDEWPARSNTYFHHGMDSHYKKRRLPSVTLTKDDFAVWSEGILEEIDQYDKMLVSLAEKKKLGMSSGVPSHLVEREKVGKAYHVKTWPLGLDASYEHTPAEPKTRELISIKSLSTAPDAGEPPAEPILSTPEIGDATMSTLEELQAKLEAQAAEIKALQDAKPVVNAGGVAVEPKAVKTIDTDKFPAVHPSTVKSFFTSTTGLGEDGDGIKEFKTWMRTGNGSSGLMFDPTGSAKEDVKWQPTSWKDMKTLYDWGETSTSSGSAVVPPAWQNVINQKRNEQSIIRRAPGAFIWNVNSNVAHFPSQGDRQADFVVTSESYDNTTGTYDPSQTAPLSDIYATIYKWTRAVKMSEELLTDANSNVEQFMSNILAAAAAHTENAQVIASTQNGHSTGLQGAITGGTLGVTAASATAITAAEVISLYHAIPFMYTDGACWVMANPTLGKIRALTGNFFSFAPTPLAGSAAGSYGLTETLYNKPYFITDTMPAATAGLKSVLIGNFAHYGFAEVGGMTIQRNPYLYMNTGQVGFFARVRFGGIVLQAEAFYYLKQPTS